MYLKIQTAINSLNQDQLASKGAALSGFTCTLSSQHHISHIISGDPLEPVLIFGKLTLTTLDLDISCFKNSVNPDQLASARSQLIKIYTVFHSTTKSMILTESVQFTCNWIKIGGEKST